MPASPAVSPASRRGKHDCAALAGRLVNSADDLERGTPALSSDRRLTARIDRPEQVGDLRCVAGRGQTGRIGSGPGAIMARRTPGRGGPGFLAVDVTADDLAVLDHH